jgi:glutamine synthetase
MNLKIPVLESPEPSARGAPDEASARQWCRERRIEDVECIIPDQAGVARGKLMPTPKFLAATP